MVALSCGLLRTEPGASFRGLVLSYFSIPYITFPLAALVLLRRHVRGDFFILYIFIVVWVGDIFAYYIGKTFGRHRLAPNISPNKSWEGTIASLLGGSITGYLFLTNADLLFAWLAGTSLPPPAEDFFGTAASQHIFAALVSLLLNLVAQIGDLCESFIKRASGVKDSGNLLPGHGGVLDRIDALLFAIPIAYLANWLRI
ncbi:MAG: CDP-archaeol synthase [Acidobacteriales bacterium]|nr:CDP-archaeol synthase [Terriglobales bacterium]